MHDASRRGHSSRHVESRPCEELGVLSGIDQDESDRGLGKFGAELNVEHEKPSILGTSVDAVVLVHVTTAGRTDKKSKHTRTDIKDFLPVPGPPR